MNDVSQTGKTQNLVLGGKDTRSQSRKHILYHLHVI